MIPLWLALVVTLTGALGYVLGVITAFIHHDRKG